MKSNKLLLTVLYGTVIMFSSGCTTTLHEAALTGGLENLNSLMVNGADIDTRDARGRTALMLVRDRQLAVDMITQGADVNARMYVGYKFFTPLKFAELRGDKGVVEALKIAGALSDKELLELDKEMLGNIRGYGSSLRKIKLLVSRGASINAIDDKQNSALAIAVDGREEYNIIKYLVANGADVNATCIKGEFTMTILGLAADRGDLNMVKFFVEHGADINVDDKGVNSALVCAVKDRKFEVVKYLVDHGADVDSVYIDEDELGSALSLAVDKGLVDIVRYLVDNGADVNGTYRDDDEQGSILALAVNEDKFEIVKYLVDNGAELKEIDINSKDSDGNTHLHKAAISGKLEQIAFFLQYGADVNTKNKDGKTALDLARKNNNKEIVSYLESVKQAQGK